LYIRHNGVYFSIKNLNSKPAFLEWDRCYFIDPAGNSSKALNVDLLQENSETVQKAKYESPIPANGSFGRFTSSALNLSKFQQLNINSINSYLFNAKINIVQTDMKTFYNFGKYWPDYEEGNDTNIEIRMRKGMEKISVYIPNNNNMGLGLGIKLNDSIMDYKFDFRFKKVTIYKDSTILKSASEANGWIWESPEKIKF